MSDRPVGVAVAGSVHMDLIATADRLPRRGETRSGHTFSMRPGGKGGNQAIQVAQQGVRSLMIGQVGTDLFGEQLRTSLIAKGVDVTFLMSHPTAETGASTVLVGEDGDYASIIVPAASYQLQSGLFEQAATAMESTTVFLIQLELHADAVVALVAMAAASGKLLIVNAAPAPDTPELFPQSFWTAIDVLIVNQVEAEMLTGEPCAAIEQARAAGERLRRRWGISTVIVTLGAAGSIAVDAGGVHVQPGWKVTAVDTLGAGDAFVGTLAAHLAMGVPVAAALPFAAAAGALTVTRAGAYDALPSRQAVERFVARRSGSSPSVVSCRDVPTGCRG